MSANNHKIGNPDKYIPVLPSEGCKECDPYEVCPKCKYLYENGGQCGGCHVFYLPDEDIDDSLYEEEDS